MSDGAPAPDAPARAASGQATSGPGLSAQDVLSRTALATFRLNGQVLEVAEGLARPVGLTAAWWQVLGAVLREPKPVAGIARDMGITRQSVQRIADLLVERGMTTYQDNPRHRRAKLVAVTEAGLDAVRAIDPGHAVYAARLVDHLGPERAAACVAALEDLSAALDALGPPGDGVGSDPPASAR